MTLEERQLSRRRPPDVECPECGLREPGWRVMCVGCGYAFPRRMLLIVGLSLAGLAILALLGLGAYRVGTAGAKALPGILGE